MEASAIDRAISSKLCPRCFTLFLTPKNEEHLKVRSFTSVVAEYKPPHIQIDLLSIIDFLKHCQRYRLAKDLI